MSGHGLPHNDQSLTGRVALVTGAGSGLGLRFARVLAAAGAKVAVAGRRPDKLQALAATIAADGGEAMPLQMDVTDAESIESGVGEVERALGLVDILVNNAGLPDAQRATRMSIELIDAVLDTNVRGPFILASEVARRLLAAKRPGRIVNIASSAAYHYTGNGMALYSVTKAAMVRMTEALAVEWAAFGINVNGIAPGAFQSEMMDGMIERMGDISARMPRGRVCDPALLDSTLLYLCAPASEAVTGTVIRVDDGQAPR